MKLSPRRRKGYSLIELLVVTTMILIMVTIALPSYLISLRDAKHRSTIQNARQIGIAIQGVYGAAGGQSYASITEQMIRDEMGGKVPSNPCTGGDSLMIDYRVQFESNRVTIAPYEGSACFDEELPTFVIRGA